MVHIYFYTRNPRRFGTEITCTLALSAENSFQFHSVYSQNKLHQLIHAGLGKTPIVIVAAPTDEELDDLLLLRNMYSHLQFILLLDNHSDATLQKAKRLQPEFLTTVHHDFRYVMSVVEALSKTVYKRRSRGKEKRLDDRSENLADTGKECSTI